MSLGRVARFDLPLTCQVQHNCFQLKLRISLKDCSLLTGSQHFLSRDTGVLSHNPCVLSHDTCIL